MKKLNKNFTVIPNDFINDSKYEAIARETGMSLSKVKNAIKNVQKRHGRL